MNLIAILLLIPVIAARLILTVLGLVLVPLTDRETNPVYGNREDPVPRSWFMTGKPEWLRDYMWRAIRNPTNNLRYFVSEPTIYDEMGPSFDPDHDVRTVGYASAYRFIRAGLYAEFWYLRACDDGEFFECRIGWKFSGTPGFAPTIQIRKGG